MNKESRKQRKYLLNGDNLVTAVQYEKRKEVQNRYLKLYYTYRRVTRQEIFEEEDGEQEEEGEQAKEAKPNIVSLKKFELQRAEEIIHGIVNKAFMEKLYFFTYTADNTNLNSVKETLLTLSDQIRDQLKEYCESKYRIIVCCTLGELTGQEIQISSSLSESWNNNHDINFNVKCLHNNFFILVNVYAISNNINVNVEPGKPETKKIQNFYDVLNKLKL